MVFSIVFVAELVLHLFFIFVLSRRWKFGTEVRFLILFVSSITLWILAIFLIYLFRTDHIALTFARLSYSAVAVASFSFLSFARVFLYKKLNNVARWLIVAGSVLSLVVFSPYFVSSIDSQSGELFPPVTFAPAMMGFVLYILMCIILVAIWFIRGRKKAQGLVSLRIGYILIGIIVAGLLGLLTNVIIPLLTGSAATAFWGPIAMSVISAFATYSMIKHRLFGIRFVVGQAVSFLLSVLFPFLAFYFVLYLQIVLWGTVYSFSAIVSGIALSAGFVALFNKVKQLIDTHIGQKLVYGEMNPALTWIKFSKTISSTLELPDLTTAVFRLLHDSLKVESVSVIIFPEKDTKSAYWKSFGTKKTQFDQDVFVLVNRYLKTLSHERVIVKAELEELPEEQESKEARNLFFHMQRRNYEAVLVMKSEESMSGIIAIGERNTGYAFSREEIEFLNNVAINLGIAYGRAFLHAESQQFNVKLQKEVEIATKKLKIQNEQLKELDKMKDDLISIAGHELRTPATVAKGNLYLLQKKLNSPDRKKYLERATDAIEREAELVTILLEASRIGKDTLELIVEPLQLEQLAREAVEDHKSSAEKKGLKLTFTAPKAAHSQIYGDKTRIREIIDNIVTNAVKYTEKGSIEIWTEEKNQQVWFHCKDTGVGIPEDEIPNLFQKFYRVKNYTSGTKHLLRPGGTGLGLYVSKNLAKRHGGDVTVESKVGVGSTFSFYIPLSFKGNLGAVKDLPHGEGEADLFKVMGLSRRKRLSPDKSSRSDSGNPSAPEPLANLPVPKAQKSNETKTTLSKAGRKQGTAKNASNLSK